MARKRAALRSRTLLTLERILRMEMLNWDTAQIASNLALAPATVAELVKTPEYKKRRDQYCNKMFKAVDTDIARRTTQTVLDDIAPDAADALAELLFSEDEVTRRQTAVAVLDRTGHSPIQRKASVKRIELDPVMAALLQKSLMAANNTPTVEEADVVDVTPE